MKRTILAATVAVAAVLLGGCSTASTTPAASSSPVASTPTEAPLAVESATPTESSADTAEAEFLAGVRAELAADTAIPNATDEQLLQAGQEACQQLAAGTPSDQITVIEGEQPSSLGYFEDSGVIVTSARGTLC